MSSTFTFGSYVAGTSALHRLDPRTKLLLGVAFLVLVLQARDFTGLLPSLVAIVSLYACARITPARALRALAPTLGIVVLVELHVDDLTEIFQQGVNMRPGAAGVAPADEVDYFHFALQSTCARRENTV